MAEVGYWLSSEEHPPDALVRHALRAEEVGFPFALISDHYHPWIDRQGQSSFVWTVLGAIAQATTSLRLGTAVTCPTMRIHPAIVAQAAATVAAMMPGRFFLGVGTGENLNEHILGMRWPNAGVRLDMLEEAIGVIRLLWQGGMRNHRGRYYEVDSARLYTLPNEPPPLLVAASGPRTAASAARLADGLIGVAPDRALIERFKDAGGTGRPRYGQLHVCWGTDEAEARRTAHRFWPIGALRGALFTELRVPAQFEDAAALVREEDIARTLPCGPDPEKHVGAIQEFLDAGFDHVSVHQIGHDQEGFFRFYEREVLPRFREQ